MLANGFPYDSFPTGWYQVAWDAALASCEVRPLKYFGADLVLARDETGAVRVTDAHCPHMGAHLGYGGVVRGCDLVCPFHHWSWGADGQNTAIPDEARPNTTRSLKVWSATSSSCRRRR